VKYFDENIRSVREDALTGLITLVIEWEDPEVASEWANLLVERLNDRMRQRALIDAESSVAYLESELNRTSLVTLQQSIGRLLESEVQKLMLARGNEEFAFRVIDPAEPPKRRVWPKRTLIVLLSTFVGGVFAITVVLLRNAFLRGKRVLPLPQ
jgi:LPS O-antigen subunit length determinant protein (WzzB/FepE family)